MSDLAGPRGHIVGLDAWRAALMLGGVLLHGSIGLPATGLFRAVDIISQTFRMGAFFGIAGVLTALVMTKRSPGAWLRRRTIQLGVPLAFGIAVLSPFLYLIARLGGAEPPPLPFQWYHLWFLAGLLLYSAIVYALVQARFDTAIVARIEALIAHGRLRPSTVLLATAVASAMLFGAAPRAMAATMSASAIAAFPTLQLIAGYLPMFLLGYLVGRIPAFSTAMLTQRRGAAAVVVAVALGYLVWFWGIAPYLDPASEAIGTSRMRFVAAAICPPAAFVLILRSALDVQRMPTIVKRVAMASYTIYLLHLPLAAAINLALRPLAPGPYLSYAIAVTGSVVLSFTFHEHVVRRSAVLALVLNGKPLFRPIPAPSAP
ncbi:MAG: hypothetical protein EOP59_05720 [Sphingomonadales bacterium]|nr:MAG: hypothetical protein EOP59_05720 [Sphingomonadales bacterium]